MKWLFKPLLVCLLLGAWIAPGYALTSSEARGLFVQAARGDDNALKTLEQAAAQGDAVAQTGLGGMYSLGIGVQQDYAQARAWYEKAAAQGDAAAQFALGLLYANGHGVRQDYAQARQWYEKAAAQGFAMAQYNLGVL